MTTTTIDTRRAGYVSGLRKLADLLEQHPELPLPYHGSDSTITFMFLHGPDAKARFAAAARVILYGTGGELEKHVSDGGEYGDYFDLVGAIDGLKIELTAYRDAVCERIVTGTREVTKTVPDPAIKVPTVEVTETVEDVRWVCRPVMASSVLP